MKLKTLLVSFLALVISVTAVSAVTLSVPELLQLVGGNGEASLGAITTEVPTALDADEYTVLNDLFVDDLEVNDDITIGGDLSVTGSVVGDEAVVSVTATTTLTAAQSGSTIYMSASGTPITLPSAAAGLNYKFVVSGAFDTGNFVIDSAEGDNIEGALIVAGAVVDCDAEDQINFVNDGENLGDFVELRSDGTSWFIGASGALATSKLTCTDPS